MMPTFIFEGEDRPGLESVRAEHRVSHRAHIRINHDNIRCILGGPLFDESSKRMIGTLLVFEATHIDDVRSFMAEDPYMRAGLFDIVKIRPWKVGLGGISEPSYDSLP
jgi:uncharacterized protein